MLASGAEPCKAGVGRGAMIPLDMWRQLGHSPHTWAEGALPMGQSCYGAISVTGEERSF